MTFYCTRKRESPVTVGAGERLISCMISLVILQCITLRESIITHRTGERLFSFMCPLVNLQVTQLVNSPIILGTANYLSCMSPLMWIEATTPGERLFTVRTSKRTFFCMECVVFHKTMRPGKLLVTQKPGKYIFTCSRGVLHQCFNSHSLRGVELGYC